MFKIIDLFFETKVLDLFRLNLTSVLLLILSMKFYSFKKTIYLSHKLTVVTDCELRGETDVLEWFELEEGWKKETFKWENRSKGHKVEE